DAVLVPVLSTTRDRRPGNVEAAAERAVIACVLRPRVVEVERQPMAEALLQRYLQRVIAEVAHVGAPDIRYSVGSAAGWRGAGVLRKGYKSLRDSRRRLEGGSSLERRGNIDTRQDALGLRDICGSRSRCQQGELPGRIGGTAQRCQVLRIELVAPVATCRSIPRCRRIDQVMALVTDVVDRQRQIVRQRVLHTKVIKSEVW